MTYYAALTLKSRNEKTGKIAVSTTTEKTCPTSCPFQKNGCYAETGPLLLFWRKVTSGEYGVPWDQFLKKVAALPDGVLFRHNQAGDLPGNRINIDKKALNALVKAARHVRGFTYTHYDVIRNLKNRKDIEDANRKGFVINVSANNLKHADMVADTGIEAPIVAVLPAEVEGNVEIHTPKGRRVVVCPATYRDDITCKTCGLCAVSHEKRKVIVGFPAHGSGKAKASVIAKE